MDEGAWLIAFVALQRFAELGLAQWNTARLRGAGGVEFGGSHYPLIVALHVFWLLGLWRFGHAHRINPIWFAIFILLQAGRLWVIASLGRRWTTRVIVLPGVPPFARGPYRWLRHPNYAVVALEFAVVPLALGVTAIRTGVFCRQRRTSDLSYWPREPGAGLGFTVTRAHALSLSVRTIEPE
jgi:methyltransferase